jgi:hypothetical protein
MRPTVKYGLTFAVVAAVDVGSGGKCGGWWLGCIRRNDVGTVGTMVAGCSSS